MKVSVVFDESFDRIPHQDVDLENSISEVRLEHWMLNRCSEKYVWFYSALNAELMTFTILHLLLWYLSIKEKSRGTIVIKFY